MARDAIQCRGTDCVGSTIGIYQNQAPVHAFWSVQLNLESYWDWGRSWSQTNSPLVPRGILAGYLQHFRSRRTHWE